MTTDADAGERSETSEPPSLPRRGSAPTAAPKARSLGIGLALIVLAAGMIVLRDTAITWGWLHGTLASDTVLAALQGLDVQWWMAPAGTLLAAVGAAMILAAVWPRRATATAVTATTSIWMAPRDVARLASHAARTVPGVLSAQSHATRRKVDVSAEATDTTPQTQQAITTTVTGVLGVLTRAPRVHVTLTPARNR